MNRTRSKTAKTTIKSRSAPQPASVVPTRYQRVSRSRLARFGLLWLLPFLVLESFLFADILKDHNYIEIFPRALQFTTAMNFATGLVIALAIYFIPWPRRLSAKLVSATLLGMLMVNYDGRLGAVSGLYRALLPLLPKPDSDLPLISLLFLLTLGSLAILAGKGLERLQGKYPSLQGNNVVVAMVIVVGFLFMGQAVKLMQVLPSMMRQSSSMAPALPQAPGGIKADGEKPDIYYLVLDRYANDQTLQEQFNYTNTFSDFLRQQNFTVKDNALANYPYTTISVSSTLNAMYTNTIVAPYKNDEVQSRALYHNLIRQSSVIKALKAGGYQYYSIGSWYGATNRAPQAYRDYMWDHMVTAFGKEKRLRGMEAVQFLKSPYYRLVKAQGIPGWPFTMEDHTQIEDVRLQLDTLDNLSTAKEQGGRFIFAHILVPHEPFFFNADGSLSTNVGTDNIGKPIKQKYTEQVQFISNQLQGIIQTINERSGGQAVVILNADEGPYPNQMNATFREPGIGNAAEEEGVIKGDMRQWPDDWLKMKFGIQQAVHIPKATEEDLQHLSSVNLFRIVLNRYLGYELPYLPNCNYALSTGSQAEYNYGNITARLQPEADPSCKQWESLP